jgi:nucleotide-binding universal stress UspA family protein
MLRSLLLPFDGGARDKTHLGLALSIARRHGARVHAVFLEAKPDMPTAVPGRGASAGYLAESIEATDRAAAKTEAWFRTALAGAGVSGDWSAELGECADMLLRRGRTSDAVLLGQGEAGALVEGLLNGVSCGLLVVPRAGQFAQVGRNVLVAWDQSRPAARAVREGLPVLREAERVSILAVGDPKAAKPRIDALTDYLDLHGIHAQAEVRHGPDTRVGSTLLARAQALGSDLIVMGAYAHSRVGEFLLGGTTRYVLREMHLPVLLAH